MALSVCGFKKWFVMLGHVHNYKPYICSYVCIMMCCTLLHILPPVYYTGVPAMVRNVAVDDNTINITGNIVTLTLSWGEPFNNLDPIVNYTVSCSGDVTCPPNFTTTDNAIIFTNLTTMTTYTFSVVATNSIGSGEAGVAMFPGMQEIKLSVTAGCCIREYVLKFYVYTSITLLK